MNPQENNAPYSPQPMPPVNYWAPPPPPAPPVPPPETVRQKTVYSTIDTVYAWLCFLFAFLFCQAVPVTKHPLGGFLVIITLFIAAFVIFRIKKIKLYPVCILTAVSALVISAALLLAESPFLVRLAYTYSLACHCYFIYAAFGNRVEAGFSDYIYIDFVKILFIFPFRSLTELFPAISNESTKKGSRVMLKLLIGIAIAVIPTIIVLSLLSYDKGFMKILDDIFSMDGDQVAHIVLSLIFTLPLAMYGFGLYASASKKLLKDQMTAENCRNGLQKAKLLPQLTAVVAVIPILFLYVIFFISQWKYYISGFTGVLPENFSYAEYARQGFFELCSVSVINLLFIIGISFFIKRSEQNKSIVLKIITLIFCVCTLILICTAVAKLVMYIDYYGLTQKRIYAMWLMVLIAIVFIIIALGQFFSKLKIVALSLSVAILMFAGLCLCNVNALTARYNTNRYLNGTLESLDLEVMDELGDSAIPYLVQVVKTVDTEKNPELKAGIDVILYDKVIQLRDEKFSIFSFSVPSVLAKASIKDYTPQIPPAGVYGISSTLIDDNTIIYGNEMYSNYLTVHNDGTGTLYYIGQNYPVEFKLGEISYNGEAMELNYYPATEYEDAWIHIYRSEEGKEVSIILHRVDSEDDVTKS